LKFIRLPFHAMGTPCEVQLYGSSRIKARRVAESVIADVQRLEALYSRYLESSLVHRINQAAATGGEIQLDSESASLFDYAQTCFEQSDGLFDITSGILRKAWDFKKAELPNPKTIESLLDKVGWQRLNWDSPVLAFPQPGMEIDLGGVVKEYAVDRAADICREQGVKHGMINLGGDIHIIGPHPDGSPWLVAIRNINKEESPLQMLKLSSGALASSGDYERCITLDGVRYGHILNPRTGWPVKCMAAVSVVSDLCVVAGSAATIGMLKQEQGKSWLAEFGLPYLWLDVDGKSGGSLIP
jgi:FAD:protein FMN transferase